MTYVKNPSQKQKKEWAEQAKRAKEDAFQLVKGVAESYRTDSQKMIEYFQFASRFYQYSPNNVCLIYSQNAYATFVQSFKDWKAVGASVKKGAKGIKILVPVQVTYLESSENEFVKLSEAPDELKALYKNNQIESVKKLHFSIGTVFDISQTTYPKEKYPDLFSMGEKSAKHKTIENALIRFAKEELSCPVKIVDLESIGLKGRYLIKENKIEINTLLEDTERLSVVTHELGHALIHNAMPKYSASQIEFEGDALSIMLQEENGIPITESRKMHIASHYKLFKKECEKNILKEHPEIEGAEFDEQIDKLLMDSFSNVFDAYRKNIDAINEYIKEEVKMETVLDSKMIQTLKNNGIKEEFIVSAIENSTLEKNDSYSCIFFTGKGSLIIPLNNFVVPADMDVKNMYYDGNSTNLYVTGNRIEYLEHVSKEEDVLLLENEKLGEIMGQIKDKDKYTSLSWGTNVSVNKSLVKEQLGLAELAPVQQYEKKGFEL